MKGRIHENLRKIRTSRNLSQEFVAESIGVSTSSYARYESGKTGITIEHVIALAKLYNMSLDQIALGFDKKSHSPPVQSVKITVELDGEESTLQYWINCLKSINKVLKPPNE